MFAKCWKSRSWCVGLFYYRMFLEKWHKTAKPLQSHCKTANRWKSSTWLNSLQKSLIIENQALEIVRKSLKIKRFAVLQWATKPTPKPADPPRPLARFLHARCPFFLYISLSLQKLQNKKQKTNQTVDRVGFGSFAVFFAVALQWLCSFLTVC
mgnify:CR=1 FL=1